jgi:lysyl endopeptidase
VENPPFIFLSRTIIINIVKQASWKEEKDFTFCKYTIKTDGALSTSMNFNSFFLPEFTEMYIYNKNGEMITGPITNKENNKNNIWGSWIYEGDILNIEIKTPIVTFKDLRLNLNNIAYGYKEMYRDEVGNFGNSASCNINVLCPLGTGWEKERNSVGLILSENGDYVCSGSILMNTCNSNRPFFLTANHCYAQNPLQDVSKWRFTFQAWSSNCTNSTNSDGVTYNGSTLRANWDGTDFCLVELNNIPPINSGIHYAGWNRQTGQTAVLKTTIIHHPKGDLMKIARDNQPPVLDTFVGVQSWRLDLDDGATEPGSSGAPYFDHNNRVFAQHKGIGDGYLSVCESKMKFGGRLNVSWFGGGTNETRLSNWLDPSGFGTLTTNTANISNLIFANSLLSINGDATVCNTSNNYTIPNLPPGSSVVWSVSPVGNVTVNNPNALQTTITKVADGYVTLTATLTNCQGSITLPPKTVYVGSPYVNGVSTTYNVLKCIVRGYKFTIPNSGATNFKWFSRNITQGTPFVQFKNGPQNWATQGGDGSCDQTEIKVETTNACNVGSPTVYTFPSDLCPPFSDGSCGSARSITASPNPTSNNIEIAILEDPNVKSKNKQALKIEMIRVINKEGEIKKTIKGNNLAKMKIDISELPADIYNIIIFDGKTWISKQIVKN